MIDIEKALFPDSGRVLSTNGYPIAIVVDVELDPIPMTFQGGGVVEIDVSKYKYITLDTCKLMEIIELIDQAEIEFPT